MMKLVDSHCHLDRLDLTAYNGNLDLALAAAKEQGVMHMLCVAIERENIHVVTAIAERYPNISASVGIHPTEELEREITLEQLLHFGSHPKVVAVGETGLDYYRNEGDLSWQQQRFRTHIQAAKRLNKPLIIHTRMAREDTIRILQEERADEIGGVMHCFTEDWHMAKQAMDLNFFISISGIVTFRNAIELKEVAKQVPLERLLIETDAPYLAPVPMRGKPNEPAYVRYVAEYIAELRSISLEVLAAQTTANFFRLFKVQDSIL